MIPGIESLFSDNRKIGIILLAAGTIVLVLGVVLLFDPVLLAMGNILFLGHVHFGRVSRLEDCLSSLVLCEVSRFSTPSSTRKHVDSVPYEL